MITFTTQRAIIKPIIVCDHCHQPIAGSGNALWLMPDPFPPDGTPFIPLSIFHTHKHCTYSFERLYQLQYGQQGFASEELHRHLVQLMNNVAIADNKTANRLYDTVDRAVSKAGGVS